MSETQQCRVLLPNSIPSLITTARTTRENRSYINAIVENWVLFGRTVAPEPQDLDGVPIPRVRLPPATTYLAVPTEHAGGVSVGEANSRVPLTAREGNSRLNDLLERRRKLVVDMRKILRDYQELRDSVKESLG